MAELPHDPARDDREVGVPFCGFDEAAGQVLRLLHDQLGLALWLVTRVVGPDQIVLSAYERPGGTDLDSGPVLPYEGSLCQQMLTGSGPLIAPALPEVPADDLAPRLEAPALGAYVGVPLRAGDGAVFGTLCGLDRSPQPESLRRGTSLLVLQARLLSTVLTLELDRDRLARATERATAEATADVLTGLANRRAWEDALEAEQRRCERYGHPASILVVDLNDLKIRNDTSGHAAGDELLRACGQALRRTARATDVVARLGGDEFGVLAVETDHVGGAVKEQLLREALRQAGVSAAVGLGVRTATGSLTAAWHAADRAMYDDKRHQARSSVGRSR